MFIYFDVADTLLHKKSVIPSIQTILSTHGYNLSEKDIRKAHKILTEEVTVPAKTSKTFYDTFNRELLTRLGISEFGSMPDELFRALDNLPWEQIPDTRVLTTIRLPMGVISNWDTSLVKKLDMFFPSLFNPVIVSGEVGIQKPDPKIFEYGLDQGNLKASETMYIGDSLKLDIFPAKSIGMRAVLIDRYNLFANYEGEKIAAFDELKKLV